MAETGKMKTYSETIEVLLDKSVVLPPELLSKVDNFLKNHRQLSYVTREEFIDDATSSRLAFLLEQEKSISS